MVVLQSMEPQSLGARGDLEGRSASPVSGVCPLASLPREAQDTGASLLRTGPGPSSRGQTRDSPGRKAGPAAVPLRTSAAAVKSATAAQVRQFDGNGSSTPRSWVSVGTRHRGSCLTLPAPPALVIVISISQGRSTAAPAPRLCLQPGWPHAGAHDLSPALCVLRPEARCTHVYVRTL